MVYIDVYIVFRVQSSSGIWLEPIHSIRRRCSLCRRSRALVQRPATWKEHNEVYVYFPIFHKEEKVYIVLLFPNMLNVVCIVPPAVILTPTPQYLPSEDTTTLQEDAALQDPLNNSSSVKTIYQNADITSIIVSRFLLSPVGHVRTVNLDPGDFPPCQPTEGKLHIPRARASLSPP